MRKPLLNPKTWLGFFFFNYGKHCVEFGNIVIGLNEFQWVFS